jgi:hypothetical protein
MSRKIERPADTPAEAYHYWHKRWCQILTEEHREEIVKAGLPGLSYTERVPDAPDGKGYFSYAFDELGQLDFMEGKGQAVAEYDSYELGLRLLSDASLDAPSALADGRFRIISRPEDWGALAAVMPLLRKSCQRAIEEAETRFGLELPKYW